MTAAARFLPRAIMRVVHLSSWVLSVIRGQRHTSRRRPQQRTQPPPPAGRQRAGRQAAPPGTFNNRFFASRSLLAVMLLFCWLQITLVGVRAPGGAPRPCPCRRQAHHPFCLLDGRARDGATTCCCAAVRARADNKRRHQPCTTTPRLAANHNSSTGKHTAPSHQPQINASGGGQWRAQQWRAAATQAGVGILSPTAHGRPTHHCPALPPLTAPVL